MEIGRPLKQDINNNECPVSTKSSSTKRVHFRTIQEFESEKKIAPPGRTPIGSKTEVRDESESIASNHTYTARRGPHKKIYYDENQNLIEEDFIVGPPPPSSPSLPPSNSDVDYDLESVAEGLKREIEKQPATITELRRKESLVSSTKATIYPSRENVTLKRRQYEDGRRRNYPNSPNFIMRRRENSGGLYSASSTEHPSDYCSSSRHYSGVGKRSLSSTTSSSIRIKQYPHLNSVLSELKSKKIVFDRESAINALKRRILRGEKVTYEEIVAIKSLSLPIHQKHLGWRLPWSTDLYCEKGLVHFPTPNKPVPEHGNTFGTVEDLRLMGEEEFKQDYFGKRRYVLNLNGFKDNEITLYLEGRNRLVIRAVREEIEEEDIPATMATETVVLPPDLPADNLRIVRRPSGTTIIEESWRY